MLVVGLGVGMLQTALAEQGFRVETVEESKGSADIAARSCGCHGKKKK